MTLQTPLVRTLEANVPAPSAANTAQDLILGKVPFDGKITAVSVIAEAAVTAHATNNRTLRVVNKKQDGSGTTVAATLALDTPGTDDLAAYDEKSIPVSGTEANVTVTAGDVLVLDEVIGGTGVAHGGFRAIVEITRA